MTLHQYQVSHTSFEDNLNAMNIITIVKVNRILI